MEDHDHEQLADELEQEADRLEREKDEVAERTAETRSGWEAKKEDSSVPGAQTNEDDVGPPPPPDG